MSRNWFRPFGLVLVVGLLGAAVVDASLSHSPLSAIGVVAPEQSSGPPSCNLTALPSRVQAEYARLTAIRVTNYPQPGFVGPSADCRVVQDDGSVIAVNFYWPGIAGTVVYIATTDMLFTQAVPNQSTIREMLNPPPSNPSARPALAQ